MGLRFSRFRIGRFLASDRETAIDGHCSVQIGPSDGCMIAGEYHRTARSELGPWPWEGDDRSIPSVSRRAVKNAMALQDLPAVAYIGIAVVTLVVIWLSTYILERLRHLDNISKNASTSYFLEDPTSLEKVPLPSVFAPASKYISLIIPAMNEEDRLPDTLDETLRFLQQRAKADASFTYEIIVVDDGSRDKTAKAAFEFVRKHSLDVVRVIKLGQNQGKGAAVQRGMLSSRGELALFMDADAATDIHDLSKLEQEILALQRSADHNAIPAPLTQTGAKQSLEGHVGNFSAAAVGSRAHLERLAIAKRKWYRNFLMRGFHLCVLMVAGPGIRDTQCGFKMFTRSAVQQIFPNQRLHRWCFDVELIYLAKALRIPIKEVAVTWTEIPGSKLRFTSIFHMLFELALVRLGYGLRFWNIRRQQLVQ